MHFQKLRLSGFKSFVEPAELAIEPGLTGIVGPNGCGKSNLVEALRWVMGETSARQLRGDEMDDVIFGGTASRPARNVAEVALHIDNAARRAPAAFNDHAEIEVSRRISRGEGSVYRVNGREVRARDVQLLFADAASGARSAALVSQGQIGALIAARPEQRRMILEEAAGVAGLHARRQEAEQRLHAAEANLARVDDVLATLDAQLQGFRRQARQAGRYRRVNEQIRRIEAALFAARWQRAQAALAGARTALDAAEAGVDEAARAAASAAAAHARAAEAVPPARRKEAEAAAALQRVEVQRDALAAEERRAAEARQAAEARLAQMRRDLDRARALAADAEAALRRLDEERATIAAGRIGEADAAAAAAERLAAAEQDVAALEAEAAQAAEAFARAEAGRSALLRQLREAEERLRRLCAQRDQAARDRAAAEAAGVAPPALAAAEEDAALADAQAEAAALAAEEAAETAAACRDAEMAARDAAQRAETELARLRAEEQTLSRLLAAAEAGRWPPVLNALSVEPGCEVALGAALGDDLDAPESGEAPIHWRTLPPYEPPPPLPAGAEPLSRHVGGAPALLRRLSQIGLVPDAATGEALAPALLPGQRLVTREGAMWRWDGLTAAAGAATPAAQRLAHRNQLLALRRTLPEAEAALARARAALEAARRAVQETAARERGARDAVRQAQAAAAERRQALARLSQQAAVAASRLSALADNAGRIAADLSAAEAQAAALRASVAELADQGEARDRADRLRAALAERRRQLLEARSLHDRQEREALARARRLAAIEEEIPSWRQRGQEAAAHVADLEARAAAEAEALAALARAPDDIGARRDELLARIEAAAERRRWAADDLAAAERFAAERQNLLKAAEAQLAAAREARIRAEAGVDAAQALADALAADIRDRFGRGPEALGELAGDAGSDGDPEALEQRLARLQREREAIGPVNLRAEEEVEAAAAQIAELQTQREDLTAAIAKLRRGIAELNREARGRLLAAFEQVDRHFRALFVRLFGGGRAELALTDSEDPLAAGLEILASPPGKRLQSLSLLSGGERAMAALSLLFAVFLTNPAPVCVLDEVDAPLDDANVDRFCALLDEIAGSAATRFLVVTHHPLTMARMDRLFGVTMAERGVSQLVSVDLRLAEGLRATA